MTFGVQVIHVCGGFEIVEKIVRHINLGLGVVVELETITKTNPFTSIIRLTKDYTSPEEAYKELEVVREEIRRLHDVLAESENSSLRVYFLKRDGDKWISLEPSKSIPLDEPLPLSGEKAETD